MSAPALNEVVLNDRGTQPSHLTASFDNIDLLRELLRHSIDVNSLNARDETALLRACRANELEAALFLMNYGTSITPQHLASLRYIGLLPWKDRARGK
jgi:ankyrin repeat protein